MRHRERSMMLRGSCTRISVRKKGNKEGDNTQGKGNNTDDTSNTSKHDRHPRLPPFVFVSALCVFRLSPTRTCFCASYTLLVCVCVELTLERGEKLENMEEKAGELESHANMFQKNATKVKRHFFCQYIKVTMLIVGIVVVLGLVIGLSIWGKNKD